MLRNVDGDFVTGVYSVGFIGLHGELSGAALPGLLLAPQKGGLEIVAMVHSNRAR